MLRVADELLIRADASAVMGTGHVMRCLALAQAWQDKGGVATFAMCEGSPVIERRLAWEGIAVKKLGVDHGSPEDAGETGKIAREAGAEWVVLDGYHFSPEYQQIIKEAGQYLTAVGGGPKIGHCYADIVLEQNIGVEEEAFARREQYTKLLLGSRYALLRREFLQWKGWRREIPQSAGKVLVTLGGSDPDNVTLKVIQALEQLGAAALDVVVLAGGSNPNYSRLEKAVRETKMSLRLERHVEDMPELLAWADVAVAAGGITSWELTFMGLPCIMLLLAENQRQTVVELDKLGVAVGVGAEVTVTSEVLCDKISRVLADREMRREMSVRGRKLIDGMGAERVLDAMKAIQVG
jgi:UDP-2,4-diacetamido-2,4,6-trideoxy-beta-L-altropyranose hydrolase